MRKGTRSPLKLLTSPISCLQDAKSRGADGQLGQEKEAPLQVRAQLRTHSLQRVLGGVPTGGQLTGLRRPQGPTRRAHPLSARPSPQGPICFEQIPLLLPPEPEPGQAAQGSGGGFSFHKDLSDPGSLQEILEASITMHCFQPPRVPGHRKEVPVALCFPKGLGRGAARSTLRPERGTERLPWVRTMACKPVRTAFFTDLFLMRLLRSHTCDGSRGLRVQVPTLTFSSQGSQASPALGPFSSARPLSAPNAPALMGPWSRHPAFWKTVSPLAASVLAVGPACLV